MKPAASQQSGGQGRWLGRCLGVAISIACLCGPGAARADEAATFILGISQGSSLTQTVETIEGGGYELAGGDKVSFVRWYHTDWPDTRIDMLTQLSSHFGILWGASTGEHGEKFNIDPAFKLGMIVQQQPTPATTLTLTVSGIFGGRLTESPCEADYGDIGGIQTVNCRLAASVLAPEETLKYLMNAAPNRLSLSLSFSGSF